jgi:hypothetical protein
MKKHSKFYYFSIIVFLIAIIFLPLQVIANQRFLENLVAGTALFHLYLDWIFVMLNLAIQFFLILKLDAISKVQNRTILVLYGFWYILTLGSWITTFYHFMTPQGNPFVIGCLSLIVTTVHVIILTATANHGLANLIRGAKPLIKKLMH